MTKMKTPQDFLVQGLEDVIPAYADFDGDMYAGLLPMDNVDQRHGKQRVGRTMFWLFEPSRQSIDDTLVIWLNGGPGCSSFNCGVLMEHSPVTQPLHNAGYCCLDATPDFGINHHAWTRATTMLYIEHPIGTGFSYGPNFPETEEEASGDLDAFLQNFFKVFTHFQKYDFFVTGESYAGMFVPAIGRTILRANQRALREKDSTRIPVQLKGVALGNGWIDPKIQGPATIDYSWWHGLIDKPTRDALHNEWENCMKDNEASTSTIGGDAPTSQPPPFHPFNVQDDCGIMWGILEAAGQPNAYDITTWDPNVDQVTFSSEAFYNSDAVKTALHAPKNITWHGCQVGSGRRHRSLLMDDNRHRRLYMDNDRPLSVVPYISELVDEGIPVLVYNGDRDMTTNMVGTELALNAMQWSGKDKWLDAPRGLWLTKDYPSGWAKELGNLTFVVVYNSGHMVPYNQPVPAFDLLQRLLTHTSFMDKEMPTLRVKREPPQTSRTVSHAHTTTTTGSAAYHGHVRWETAMGIAVIAMLVGGFLTRMIGKKFQMSRERASYETL